MNVSKWIFSMMVSAGLITMVGPALAQEKITVWWTKGFYKAEDDALFNAIKKFENLNKNVKIDLSLYATQDIIPKTVAAIDSGNPPDVAYGTPFDFQVTAKWAYEGKLENISSIVDKVGKTFEPAALSTTYLYNKLCISNTGKTCWLKRVSRKRIFQKIGRVIGIFGAQKFKLAIARKPINAHSVQVFHWQLTQLILSSLS